MNKSEEIKIEKQEPYEGLSREELIGLLEETKKELKQRNQEAEIFRERIKKLEVEVETKPEETLPQEDKQAIIEKVEIPKGIRELIDKIEAENLSDFNEQHPRAIKFLKEAIQEKAKTLLEAEPKASDWLENNLRSFEDRMRSGFINVNVDASYHGLKGIDLYYIDDKVLRPELLKRKIIFLENILAGNWPMGNRKDKGIPYPVDRSLIEAVQLDLLESRQGEDRRNTIQKLNNPKETRMGDYLLGLTKDLTGLFIELQIDHLKDLKSQKHKPLSNLRAFFEQIGFEFLHKFKIDDYEVDIPEINQSPGRLIIERDGRAYLCSEAELEEFKKVCENAYQSAKERVELENQHNELSVRAENLRKEIEEKEGLIKGSRTEVAQKLGARLNKLQEEEKEASRRHAWRKKAKEEKTEAVNECQRLIEIASSLIRDLVNDKISISEVVEAHIDDDAVLTEEYLWQKRDKEEKNQEEINSKKEEMERALLEAGRFKEKLAQMEIFKP